MARIVKWIMRKERGKEMIPKKIHYCWVGNTPLTPLAEKCIASWKKYCPDYEIIKWDESNYNFFKNEYMKQAYEAQKWGFVPDYARLDIVYQYGGIYLDTDVELLKPLDYILENRCFCGVESYLKDKTVVALGLGFGAEEGFPLIKEMMETYDKLDFIKDDGSLNLIASPIYQTEFLYSKGLIDTKSVQNVCDITIYPKDYFNPMNLDTGEIALTKNTISIHHYAGSWLSNKQKKRYEIHKTLNRIIGVKATDCIRKLISFKW